MSANLAKVNEKTAQTIQGGELRPTIDPMVSMIERVATDPSISIEKLERMLAMKERLEDRALEERGREQRQEYYRAMSKCQAALKVVARNKYNEQTKSRYADLAALAESIDPIIHEHEFTVSFQPAGTAESGGVRIRWTIAHSSGHVESDVAEIPLDATGQKGTVNKTATHAFGSTISYGRRYLKLMLFDIATGDDNDGNRVEVETERPATITEEQALELEGLCEDQGLSVLNYCKSIGVANLLEIHAKYLDFNKKRLNERKAKVQARAQANARGTQ